MINWSGLNAVTNNNLSVISRRQVNLLMWLSDFLTPVLNTILFPSYWLLFHIERELIMEGEWRLSTCFKRRKECWPSWDSNSQPREWQFTLLPDERPSTQGTSEVALSLSGFSGLYPYSAKGIRRRSITINVRWQNLWDGLLSLNFVDWRVLLLHVTSVTSYE